ncbi:MAG: glucose-6-phosphate isomerase, partial [Bacteroidetes bacterium]|nr:glucose-6-phosphate isomerase [Bacteroidota bacterium]
MNKNLSVNTGHLGPFVATGEILALASRAGLLLDALVSGTGEGSDFTGWITLPSDIEKELNDIEASAARLRQISDTTVVIGIGGSYLGSRAVLEALGDSFGQYRNKRDHQVLFAGQNLCPDYMHELLTLLDERDYSIIVISKSGTTTEPAVAFRLLRSHLIRKTGRKEAAARIVAVTDKAKGALRKMADSEGYKTFVIPDNVGGRYSVLTAVGLLPIAVGGIDIRELVKGAYDMKRLTADNHNAATNPALLYAAARNLLYTSGRNTEILVNYTPKLHCIAEWWKQLFGESEGKDGRGIFPAAVDNT